ncbi:MAG: hypothetical protein Q8N47_17610 [Bryobacterales bacterium]|nr:hypothetical protein [Bryobacterales bacterium]
MSPLEKELETELLAIYEKCSAIGYRPTYFKRMLTTSNLRFYKGPVGTVRHLMFGEAGPTSGFRRLVKAGKLTWTVEWLIANNPKWQPLFQKSEWVVEKAKARIREARAPN